jgi:uncharacterized protein (UPF0335 family)
VKVERKITAAGADQSRSIILTRIVEQNSEGFAGEVVNALIRRQKKENELLESEDVVPLPYGRALGDVRAWLERVDAILEEEAAVDASVSEGVREIRELKREIVESQGRIGEALRERAEARQALDQAAVRLARTGEDVVAAVREPQEQTIMDYRAVLNLLVVVAPLVLAYGVWCWRKPR